MEKANGLFVTVTGECDEALAVHFAVGIIVGRLKLSVYFTVALAVGRTDSFSCEDGRRECICVTDFDGFVDGIFVTTGFEVRIADGLTDGFDVGFVVCGPFG